MVNPRMVLCLKRLTFLILFVALFASFLQPVGSYTKESRKTVRVGWYESPVFNILDESERRSGYAYPFSDYVISSSSV